MDIVKRGKPQLKKRHKIQKKWSRILRLVPTT